LRTDEKIEKLFLFCSEIGDNSQVQLVHTRAEVQHMLILLLSTWRSSCVP